MTLENVFVKLLSHENIITEKTAYKITKKNQSFHHFVSKFFLWVEMGILHSTNAFINIIIHISEEMKKTVVKRIIESKNKIVFL